MAPAEYDVVVAGAGSAGCAVAAALVEQGARVCLIEAGPDYGPRTGQRWPAEILDPHRRPKTHDWGYDEEDRARVMGGCSSHNQCAALWPDDREFDAWAALGNPGWTARELQPFKARVDTALDPRPYPDRELASWQKAFAAAAGIGSFPANVRQGVRWNAAFAFLDPVRRRTALTIIDDTLADRLVFTGARARSLIARRRGRRETLELRAARFVLCGGAFGSPMILQRSGVGPRSVHRRLRIRPVLEREGVGRNLQEHPGIGLLFEPSEAAGRALVQDLVAHRFYQSQVIWRTRSRAGRGGEDIHLLPYQSLGASDATFGILAFNVAPQSRGTVTIAARDARRKPAIDMGYLRDAGGRDLAVLVDAVSLARRLARRPALRAMIDHEIDPGPRRRTAAQLRRFIRADVSGYSHPVGTCAMGSAADPMAVVDARGRVHGLDNVVVADASIMPVIPRVNTNLTAMLVALRVAAALTDPS